MANDFDVPQSRNEAILQNMLGADNVLDVPQSRNEAILQNMLGADNVLDVPQSRIEALLQQILEQGGTGGEITLDDLTATDNGTYTPQSGHAYKKVVVEIPNTLGVKF